MTIQTIVELVAVELSHIDDAEWLPSDILEELDPPQEPDATVQSECLLCEYVGHIPQFQLQGYSTKQEMEARILSDAGITNGFTTAMIPVVRGKVLKYEVLYSDANGKNVVFSKSDQLAGPQPFVKQYNNLRMNWK